MTICPNDPCAVHGVVGPHLGPQLAHDPNVTPDWDRIRDDGYMGWITESQEDYEKGVTLVAIVHGDDGNPAPILIQNIRPGETIRVDFTTGQVSVNTKRPPTVINADTGVEFTPEERAAAARAAQA